MGRGDSEIGQGRALETGEENIGGLDITMQDVLPVYGLNCARELHRVLHRQCGGEHPVRHPDPQVGRGTFLHDQEGSTIGGQTRTVDGDDIRVS